MRDETHVRFLFFTRPALAWDDEVGDSVSGRKGHHQSTSTSIQLRKLPVSTQRKDRDLQCMRGRRTWTKFQASLVADRLSRLEGS